jgi:type IV secretion system protein TrbE
MIFFIPEYVKKPSRLSHRIPWFAFVSENVLTTKDGALQATIEYRGPDLDSSTSYDLLNINNELNESLKAILGEGYSVYVEQRKELFSKYPEDTWDRTPQTIIPRLIDEERRKQCQSKDYYQYRSFLTLTYLPPILSSKKVKKLFQSGESDKRTVYEEEIADFQEKLLQLTESLERFFSEVILLDIQSTVQYLHSTISNSDFEIEVNEACIFLDSMLVDTDFVNGYKPKLGDKHLRVISLMHPGKKCSPGCMEAIGLLEFEHRWVTRFIALGDRQAESLISAVGNKHKNVQMMGVDLVLRAANKDYRYKRELEEQEERFSVEAQVGQAKQVVRKNSAIFGYYTTLIVIKGDTEEEADNRVAETVTLLQSLKLTPKVESVFVFDAWLASLPGNVKNFPREYPLHTANLTRMLPISTPWAGQKDCKHLKGPSLFVAKTRGNALFNFVLHIIDNGMLAIYGPTGSGKSVFLNYIAICFLRYINSQVNLFDIGGSSTLITHAVGGSQYRIGDSKSAITFQPYARIHEDAEREWAIDWTIDLLLMARESNPSLEVSPEVRNEIASAINEMSSFDVTHRTIRTLQKTIDAKFRPIKEALQEYVKGAYSVYFDKHLGSDVLKENRFQCFQLDNVIDRKNSWPVISCLFHEIERRYDGRPTLNIIDESRKVLQNEYFFKKATDWFTQSRKKNVANVVATQSLSDFSEDSTDQKLGRLENIILESCQSVIFLPNERALSHQRSYEKYESFGLNRTQIELIANAQRQRHYYYTSPLGNRLIDLDLGRLARTYLSTDSKTIELVRTLAASTNDLWQFNEAFMKEKRLRKELEELLEEHIHFVGEKAA